MSNHEEDLQTRTFDFKRHQINVSDTALLLDCSVDDVTALIRMGHLEAEGKRPYKVNVKSVVEYKRTMAGSEDKIE